MRQHNYRIVQTRLLY